jgi:hypothetical protein
MKKMIMVLLVLASVFLLVSCGEQQQQTQTKGAFIGGTQGVVGDFSDFGVLESGVSSVFDSETFPVEIVIKNKGEYDIQSGDVNVKLIGLSKDEFSGIPAWEMKNSGVVDKVTELLPEGGEETVTFATDAQYVKPVSGVLDRTWFASLEYKYQTYLVIPEVCLKEDLTDKRICEVSEMKSFSVSGAPITVSSVKEQTAGKGLLALHITVRNVGGGKVAKPSDSFGLQEKIAYSIDDEDWVCISSGKTNEAKLSNGETTILCKLKQALEADTLATKQVRLTFDYQYQSQIQKDINIKESIE